MKIYIESPTETTPNLMRRLGYTFQRYDGDEMSFVRPLGKGGFPRFHVYAKTTKGANTLNIHLDQKKETYGKDTRHHGEYEDDGALAQEVKRIQTSLEATSSFSDFEP